LSVAHGNGDDEEMITGINVTPLVDVALVLLVILMVTATYIAARTIPLDLPKAQTGEALSTTLAISIDSAGATFVDGKAIGRAELRREIKALRSRSTETRAVIAADGACHHRAVVGVIDLLRQEGVSQFAINVQHGELAEHEE
jgi:biopolymer transport protein ExbD